MTARELGPEDGIAAVPAEVLAAAVHAAEGAFWGALHAAVGAYVVGGDIDPQAADKFEGECMAAALSWLAYATPRAWLDQTT